MNSRNCFYKPQREFCGRGDDGGRETANTSSCGMNRECSNDGAARMYLLFDSDEISKLASIQGTFCLTLEIDSFSVLLI
ncbi:hypothetical protein SLEP1_g36932 [Rubroshorea leprosula]|uniref:Uncharacterized protein n=1 Tax=Rubroshorea leprosula TaxID=152421 RepID=A0AAV5KT16_9ROSI|nr:hypothetical protein SLEP1_g36932 [Rubroshorea leprosula]